MAETREMWGFMVDGDLGFKNFYISKNKALEEARKYQDLLAIIPVRVVRVRVTIEEIEAKDG